MFLAQISDTHLLPVNEHDPVALKRADNLERCVNTINRMIDRPLAVIHTGDMVNYAPPESARRNGYELAFEILSKLKMPFYPAVGNRDSRPALIERFLAPDILHRDAPFCQYRISLEDFDLICVDTKSDTRNIGASCNQRLAELDNLLRRDTSRPVFIFLHHPPTPVKALKNPLQFESIGQAQAMTRVFDKYDNIVRILCGHTHRSDLFPMGRHMASTLPSLATDVRLDHYPPRFRAEPVFQVHELHTENSVTSMSHFAFKAQLQAA